MGIALYQNSSKTPRQFFNVKFYIGAKYFKNGCDIQQ